MIYAIYLLLAVLTLIAFVMIVAALRPSEFRVARSIAIETTPEKLFPYINSLKRFHEWNPYKEKDPNAKNDFTGPDYGPGSSFHWAGNSDAGEGTLTIRQSEPDSRVSLDLHFLKPFQCNNSVEFCCAAIGEHVDDMEHEGKACIHCENHVHVYEHGQNDWW